MNSHTSFCLNPNPVVSEGGSPGANEGFFWESQLWPFGIIDHTSAAAAAGGEDVKGKVVGEEGDVARSEKKNECKAKRKAEADVETHIYTERERRKKMRDMFFNLHAMLPQLPPKTDKTTIVDEAVKQIKTLETQLEKLQEQKANKLRCSTNATITYEPSSTAHLKQAGQTSRESFLADHAAGQTKTSSVHTTSGLSNHQPPLMFHTWTSPNVVLNTFGQEAQIMICSPRKFGLLTSVVLALEKNMIEVESANVSCDGKGSFYMIHVRLASGAIEQSLESFSADGVFKEAVREMIALFPSK